MDFRWIQSRIPSTTITFFNTIQNEYGDGYIVDPSTTITFLNTIQMNMEMDME